MDSRSSAPAGAEGHALRGPMSVANVVPGKRSNSNAKFDPVGLGYILLLVAQPVVPAAIATSTHNFIAQRIFPSVAKCSSDNCITRNAVGIENPKESGEPAIVCRLQVEIASPAGKLVLTGCIDCEGMSRRCLACTTRRCDYRADPFATRKLCL